MRKFLVVMDDSQEFLNALRFAAIRARKTGGGVAILGIIEPADFQHWLGVEQAMRAEARERIEEHFKIFSKWMEDSEGFAPELCIQEGEPVAAVMAQIKADPEIGILVLGAGAEGEGPGPLVSQLVARQGGNMPIPVTVVPGSMTKEAIIAVS